MSFIATNTRYEAWLKTQLPVIEGDLHMKHEYMAESPFMFFRATFFRFAEHWKEHAGDFLNMQSVLAVGDLHIENYGTWRDLEGRLVWGINDLDEVSMMPFTIDIIRLLTSIEIARQCQHIEIKPKVALECLLEGYITTLEKGGKIFVLEENHSWLRDIAMAHLREPDHFWAKMNSLQSMQIPKSDEKLLRKHLPKDCASVRFAHREAGLGSLGRARFVALAELHGGMIAREVKALAPSAYDWAIGKPTNKIRYAEILEKAYRMRDPYFLIEGRHIVRRLAPHCTKIGISTLPEERDEEKLITAMGAELANVHLGTKKSKDILKQVKVKKAKSWSEAVDRFTELCMADWKEWGMYYVQPHGRAGKKSNTTSKSTGKKSSKKAS